MKKQVKKKVLITGASGFVGRNLAEQLVDEYDLLLPTHQELDLLDEEEVKKYFKKHAINVVIHCAVVGGSRSKQQPSDALTKNLKMFFNIINNRKHYPKLIILGSGAEYDKSRPIIKVKEEEFGLKMPKDSYGLFKYLCSKYLEQTNDKNIYLLRIFGLYGKYEDARFRFISHAIKRNLKGLSITMDQNVYFDYLYIDDFVKIIKYFIDHQGRNQFYNLTSGKRVSLLSLAKKINKIADKESKITITKAGLNNEYTADNSLLLKEIKNIKFTSHQQAIKQLYAWYKNKTTLK